ncbi:MAG: HAD hydrolase-like protein [Candidatus Peribacteraceae bacterium]
MSLSAFPAVLFDLDETLAHSAVGWDAANREAALLAIGINLTESEMAQTVHIPLQRILEAREVSCQDVAQVIATRDRILPAHLREHAIWADGAEELLERLRSLRKSLALVTNSHDVAFSAIDAKLNIKNYFPSIVLAGHFGRRMKPDPFPIKVAQEVLQATDAQTVLVGDNHNDEQAAKNARVSFIFTPGHRTPQEMMERHVVHHTMRSLLASL